MDDNEQNLIKLLRAVETMSGYRRDLVAATDAFSKALSMLASCEENTSLARTLSHLTETYENIEQLHGMQAEKDCALFAEAINEQLQIIYTFKVFKPLIVFSFLYQGTSFLCDKFLQSF